MAMAYMLPKTIIDNIESPCGEGILGIKHTPITNNESQNTFLLLVNL